MIYIPSQETMVTVPLHTHIDNHKDSRNMADAHSNEADTDCIKCILQKFKSTQGSTVA